ncbi:MAG: serine hydrolase, partial [Myxococcota bacterium]
MNVLFREREHNRTLRFRIDGIKVRGTQAVFTSSRGQPLQGRLIDDGNRMLLSLPWTDAPVVLKRSPEGRLPGFNSRVHGTQTPLRTPTADGEWPVVTLESAGVTRGPIEELVQELANAKPSSPVDPMVHALLVARGGSLVLEEYFFGHGPEDLHDTRSAGKSVGSMLFGAVAAQRNLDAAAARDLKICDLSNEHSSQCSDPRRASITVGNALAMQTGIQCDDDDYDSPGNEERMQEQSEEPNWHTYMLSVPMAREPGTKAIYCSGGINLAGLAARSLGQDSIPALFDALIARPLGIERYHYNLDPSHRGYLGGGVRFRARDLLKLGELMRNQGVWRGTQVLRSDWVTLSTSPSGAIHEENDYAYGWWRRSYAIAGRTVEAFHASGNGGQLLFVVPEFDLVVLF